MSAILKQATSRVSGSLAPGAFRAPTERWGRFDELFAALDGPALVVVDRLVARRHPHVARALRGKHPVVVIGAGEASKRLRAIEPILSAGASLPRSATLVAIGGGTIGDAATVAAHLLRRGLRLIQVPSTLLAAVDSSIGGKGALHVKARGGEVKNAIGVFHYPDECWLCPELFESLSAKQSREGRIEAYKMAVCLDAQAWHRYRRAEPPLKQLILDARALKHGICSRDPYDQEGLRQVLNFGHTFGHVLESATKFRLSHGEAVGLGVLCALDLGRQLGVTPPAIATEVEEGFAALASEAPRKGLARALKSATVKRVELLLRADKKVDAQGALKMVLLKELGLPTVRPIRLENWKALLPLWRLGARP